MNILPLVFAFLFIFTSIASTFFREAKSSFLIEQTIHGYNRTERALCNKVVRKAYQKKTRQTQEAKKTEGSGQQKKKHSCMRELFPPLENSKFNLSPLFTHQGEVKLHPLYQPLINFLKLLYGQTLLSKEKHREKLEERLVEEILKQAKKYPEAKNLAELCPQDPHLKRVYRKMLRGTNQYSKDKGIPPLEHFLRVEKSDKAVSLCFASPLLLEALFGNNQAAEIQELERQRAAESNVYYYISKADLQEMMMNNPIKTSLLAALDPFLDCSKQFIPRDRMGGRDNITGIAVEFKLKQSKINK